MSSKLLTTIKKTAGRNSSGRITSFHRGGGAKRQFRKIDLKRTAASVGVVERIEYDPNRSCRIALVRWQEGVRHKKPNPKESFPRPNNLLDSTVSAAATSGPYYLSNLCNNVRAKGNVGGIRRGGSTAAYAVVGVRDGVSNVAAFNGESGGELKETSVKDVLLSAFSKGGDKFSSSMVLPRMAVAGAKPAYFVAKERGEADGKDTFSLDEIKKWKPDSVIWDQRIKRQAAVSWHSFVDDRRTNLGLLGVSEVEESKTKDRKERKMENGKADRSAVSYIIASHQLRPGQMVMNYSGSKPAANHA